jgi:hypothetical protein
MSRSKNTIKASDATTTPIKLKYSSSFTIGTAADYGITVNTAVNGPVTITGSIGQSTINYKFLKQLYYQNYLTSSVNFSSSYYDWNQQSTACSGSFEFENRYFPTASETPVRFIAIPRNVFGEQISRGSLVISNPGIPSPFYKYTLADDGNGNLIVKQDGFTNSKGTLPPLGRHVGNVIYSQGLVIITTNETNINYLYTDLITGSFTSCSFYAETTIYQNQYICRVNENDFNYTLNPSATISTSTGSYIDAVTGSDFRPYATTVGLYNSKDELLVVGKLSTPYPIPPNTDISFVVRYDS